VTVTVAASPSSVNENGGSNITYTFTRSSTTGSLDVNYSIGGTATSGTDYTIAASPVSFSPGSATATVTMTPTGDSTVESNETVVITVIAGTGYVPGSPAVATGTITNDDSSDPTIVNTSVANLPFGTTNKSASLGFTPTAGNHLVAHCIAAATFSVPTGWTRRANRIVDWETVVFTKVSDGTETTLDWTQNAARQARVVFIEVANAVNAPFVSSVVVQGDIVSQPTQTSGSVPNNSLFFYAMSRGGTEIGTSVSNITFTVTGDLTELADGRTGPGGADNEGVSSLVMSGRRTGGAGTLSWTATPAPGSPNIFMDAVLFYFAP
jgi:hypothetical protein